MFRSTLEVRKGNEHKRSRKCCGNSLWYIRYFGGAASIRISNLSAVREYFQQGDTTEFIEARKNIYAKIDQNIKIDKNDVEASRIVAFFHFWGLMVKKGYLPLWVFESASGQSVMKLYEGLNQMIAQRREDNAMYGEYFEWLYKKVKKKMEPSGWYFVVRGIRKRRSER